MKNFVMGLLVGIGLTVLFFINFSSRYDIHMSGRLPIRTDRWTGKVELINVYQKTTLYERSKTVLTDEEINKLPDAPQNKQPLIELTDAQMNATDEIKPKSDLDKIFEGTKK